MNGLTDRTYCSSGDCDSGREPKPASAPTAMKIAEAAKAPVGRAKRANVSAMNCFHAGSHPIESGSAAMRFQTSEENPGGVWLVPQDLRSWSSWESFMSLECVDTLRCFAHRQSGKPSNYSVKSPNFARIIGFSMPGSRCLCVQGLRVLCPCEPNSIHSWIAI